MNTHLVIPDPHAKHGVNNDRFELAGKLALDRKPDYIWNMGDWFDMPSLSSYDKGRKSFEGRRYHQDIAAGRDALKRFAEPIEAFNRSKRKNGKKQYRPSKKSLIGNHEERIIRACEISPELAGTLSYADFGFEEYGWEVHNFLEVVNVDGINFSHYFASGVLGRAIGGEHPAASLLKKQFESCVAGHLHLRDFAQRTTASGNTICGLLAGCFFEHYEQYAGPANNMWWRGLVMLHEAKDGIFDPEFISLERLWKLYG